MALPSAGEQRSASADYTRAWAPDLTVLHPAAEDGVQLQSRMPPRLAGPVVRPERAHLPDVVDLLDAMEGLFVAARVLTQPRGVPKRPLSGPRGESPRL